MKKLLVLTMCFVFVGGVNSFAEQKQGHICKVAVEMSERHYKEPGIMEQKGLMYGVLGSYTYRNKFILRAE